MAGTLKRKALAVLCGLGLALCPLAPAVAAENDNLSPYGEGTEVNIKLTDENIKVQVPTQILFSMDSNGKLTSSEKELKIVNESICDVWVTTATVKPEPSTGWNLKTLSVDGDTRSLADDLDEKAGEGQGQATETNRVGFRVGILDRPASFFDARAATQTGGFKLVNWKLSGSGTSSGTELTLTADGKAEGISNIDTKTSSKICDISWTISTVKPASPSTSG